MPALSVIESTPRDCPSPFYAAEADTSILVPGEASAMPLGRNSKGSVVAATMMMSYMGGAGKHNFLTPTPIPYTLDFFVGAGTQTSMARCA
jgi:hypothetical protein